MKENNNKNDNKNHSTTFIIAGLSAVCIAILIAAHFIANEPETDFIPASTEITTPTDTWAENESENIVNPETTEENTSQVTGSEYDSTQEVISEDTDNTVTSLSDSTSKEDIEDSKPAEKPETTDNKTNPDKQPEYEADVPQTSEADNSDTSSSSSGGPSDSHPGQVYDPVFGWITTGDTNQSAVDSDGNISKQVGTME